MRYERFYWLATLVLVFSAFSMPFFVTAALFVIFTVIFKNFYTGLLVLFAMDAVYGFETIKFGLFSGMITICAIIVYIIISVVKERIFVSR